MKISLTESSDGHAVQSYAVGRVIVSRTIHTQSLVLMPDRVIPGWRPQCFEELTSADFDDLVNLGPEIILLGTGARQRFPSPALYFSIVENGIGFESMGTAAACRTYNILLSEGRRVAAALMMI